MNSYEREGRALAALVRLGYNVYVNKNLTVAIGADESEVYSDVNPSKVLNKIEPREDNR